MITTSAHANLNMLVETRLRGYYDAYPKEVCIHSLNEQDVHR